jgi:PUA domain protein
MKKWVLSRHDSMDMVGKVEASVGLGLGLGKSAQARCEEPAEGVVFVNLDGMTFIQSEEGFLPFLGSKETLALFPSATVDEGAIKFMLNGADVMRPGIKSFDQWGEPGKLVVVKEEKKGRAIAIGKATVASAEAQSMTKGVCLKNVHHVGDRYWTIHRQV